MNYVILMKVNNGWKNLLEDSWDIFLRENSSSFYFIEKITAFTKLQDQNELIFPLENLKKLINVGMI